MTPEGKVKEQVKKILRDNGVWFFMPVPLYHRGVPDFICCYKGQFLGIETKAGKGKPTALQQLCMADIVAAEGRCIVINEKNIDELEKWLHGGSNSISTKSGGVSQGTDGSGA